MSGRDWKLRVQDILESIEKILRYTKGMTFKEFEQDEKTIDAVIRNFTVIGEAAPPHPQGDRRTLPRAALDRDARHEAHPRS